MSKKAKILLVISGLFTLAIGLSNVFVNIFLWKKTKDYVLITQYNLMQYLLIPISYILAGWLSKRKNGIWSLRGGIGLFVIFFLSILLLKDQVVSYVIPLGVLFGIASGFYWLAFQVLSFDFTATNNRDTFNGFNGSVIGIANAIAPFTAAFIIAKSKGSIGYTIVFGISLALFIILILVSLLLRAEHYGQSLNYKKILSRNNSEWSLLRKSTFAWGLRDMVILFLISILIFKTAGNEMALGKLSLISYLISSIAYVLEQKYIKPKKRRFSIHLGAFFMFIAVIGLVIKINYIFLFIYVVLDALFMPFFVVPMTSAIFNIIEQKHEKDMRTEYIINREIALDSGRAVSACLLITLLTFVHKDRVLNYFLLFIGCAQFIALYFLRKMTIWETEK